MKTEIAPSATLIARCESLENAMVHRQPGQKESGFDRSDVTLNAGVAVLRGGSDS